MGQDPGAALVTAAITGWGSALPPNVVTNADFAERLDTSDAWIVERTGIRERRAGSTAGQLAIDAGRQAIAQAGVDPADVGLVVLATTTPDQTMPATATLVHQALGLGGGAYDLNAACSGFTYGLFAAYGALATGAVDAALMIGSDTMTTIVDQDDRSTAVLFGDGAGAVVLERAPQDHFLGWDLGTDSSAYNLLEAKLGGTITMDGKEVYRRAVRATVSSATAALDRAGCSADDIALFVPHQANIRIIEAVGSRLGIPLERTAINVDRTGNTSAGSIPLALVEAIGAGRLADGDLVLLSGFGAGMSWASAVVRWGGTSG